MPRHTHLLRRGSRYYVNVKVPKDLRGVLKKDIIRKALKTSDPREAARRVRLEALRVHTDFENERAKLRGRGKSPNGTKLLCTVSDGEARSMALRWFAHLEELAEWWWSHQGIDLSEIDFEETLDSLRIDETALLGGGKHYLRDDGSHDLDAFLAGQKIDCPKNSAAYEKLRPLFRRARLENTRRIIDRLTNKAIEARDSLFRQTFAGSNVTVAPGSATIGDLLHRFARAQRSANRSAGTQMTYEIPARILREVLGEHTPLADIMPEDIEKLCDLLREFPKNAAQRYPGFTLQQAIEQARKRGDFERLGPKTLANYFNNIVTIFNFAVEKRLIPHNPAKDRWLRQSFNPPHSAPKTQFTIEELNQLFRAPLYTGCKDDETGYAVPGPNKPRKGRFWVPLLSLFHGLRCNEATQLYTEDVKQIDRQIQKHARRLEDSGSPTRRGHCARRQCAKGWRQSAGKRSTARRAH
jgi:hypothetical protein